MKESEILGPANPTHLSFGLNWAVFLYEILNAPAQAVSVATDLFERGMGAIDTLGEDEYRDTTLVLQLLRDNLTLWTCSASQAQNRAEQAQAEGQKEGEGGAGAGAGAGAGTGTERGGRTGRGDGAVLSSSRSPVSPKQPPTSQRSPASARQSGVGTAPAAKTKGQ